MKAIDTVIKDLSKAILDNPDLPMGQAVAKAQAEISFKMGYNQALKDIKDGLSPSDMV